MGSGETVFFGQGTSGTSGSDPLQDREQQVAERMREMSQYFTIRQVASIHDMSVPGLKTFADRHGIVFHDNGGHRTKRIASERIAREKEHTRAIIHRSLDRRPVTSIDSAKITPELRERARRRDQEESNAFINMLRELGKSYTKEQATKIARISPIFMRNLAYEHEITFVDEKCDDDSQEAGGSLIKMHQSLFRPSRGTPASAAELMRRHMISDVEDEV